MKRVRTQKPTIRRGRFWPEILLADPRDPDVVRAKTLARAHRVARLRRMRQLTDLNQAARALVNRPAMPLADEPTGALDTANGKEIGELLRDLNRSGQTLVLVTHNPDLAARYASRTIQVADGQIASEAKAGARR